MTGGAARVAAALGVSLSVHALLAAVLVVALGDGRTADDADTVVSLDLSSVELSFSEQEDEQAAAAFQPEPSAAELRPAPPAEPPRPEPPSEDDAAVPQPERAKLEPPPAEERPQVDRPPDAAPRQARVDAPPRPRRAIRPDYPRGARRRGEQGDVLVEMRVDADGRVTDARVVATSGHAELDEAALRAVRAATFVPARSGETPVPSTARLTLTFKLK